MAVLSMALLTMTILTMSILTMTQFKPDFPAGSPYVTAVGGTDFDQKSVVGTEKAS